MWLTWYDFPGSGITAWLAKKLSQVPANGVRLSFMKPTVIWAQPCQLCSGTMGEAVTLILRLFQVCV